MFGLGDSNKSKLEENMDEIKQMVDGEENVGEQKTQEASSQTLDRSENSREPSSASFDQPEQKDEQKTEKRLQEEIEKFEQDNQGQEKSLNTKNSDSKPEVDEGKYSRDNTDEKSSPSGTEIPEPAKTRDLDVPEIEKGPLFITRRKFETATRLIYEMRGLSNEIESTVQGMEQELKRERDSEQQIQAILNEFEQDRKDVEGIISPK